ncbi:MAG: hypothetical protein H6747_12470 [Deltaproteobacteria bacterium]|nr:hypothetical protein [Deltaproteobacteria bacterium]
MIRAPRCLAASLLCAVLAAALAGCAEGFVVDVVLRDENAAAISDTCRLLRSELPLRPSKGVMLCDDVTCDATTCFVPLTEEQHESARKAPIDVLIADLEGAAGPRCGLLRVDLRAVGEDVRQVDGGTVTLLPLGVEGSACIWLSGQAE